MDKREKGHTHQLSFQKGFLKSPLNISAALSPARSLLHSHTAREAGKYFVYFRWPNASSETEVLFLKRKESMDKGAQQFLPQHETFSPEMA